jgi:hypothetical protein
MPRQPKFLTADPLKFDREGDTRGALETSGLPGGEIFLTSVDLAKRWRTSPDAIRKLRERNGGPPFVCLNRRRILYRLLDIRSYEANRWTFNHGQARVVGLL